MTLSGWLTTSKIPISEARIIAREVLQISQTDVYIHSERTLTQTEIKSLDELAQKRRCGMPLAYVIQKRSFWKDEFFTPQGVLIPQPDSETLVEVAVKTAKMMKAAQVVETVKTVVEATKKAQAIKAAQMTQQAIKAVQVMETAQTTEVAQNVKVTKTMGATKDTHSAKTAQTVDALQTSTDKSEISILDICSGTGCIGISIIKEICGGFETSSLTLSDVSQIAHNCFSKNADKILGEISSVKVTKCIGNLFEPVPQKKYHIIVSNPPYVKTDEISTLDAEVQAEPRLALDGGFDGLDFYRRIANECTNYLAPNGCIILEIGKGQAAQITEIFKRCGFSNPEVYFDLAAVPRVLKFV